MTTHPQALRTPLPNVELVHLADVQADPSYQRDLRQPWVKELSAKWDPDRAGVLYVSRRADGTLWLLDGQHRLQVLRQLGFATWYAEVRYGLSVAQEADEHLARNDAVLRQTYYDRWRCRVAAEHPDALAMIGIVGASGYRLGAGNRGNDSRHHDVIVALEAVETVYRMGVLPEALALVREHWYGLDMALSGTVLRGLGAFLKRGQAKADRLAAAMGRTAPSRLLVRAQDLATRRRAVSATMVDIQAALAEAYNKGLRGGQRLSLYPPTPGLASARAKEGGTGPS